ncbi:hypothetical protein HPULCUR_010116 [Helicostylum pulchrum]|uniref:Uncharacterized protein n=1 Tax=Helicostylum pulchrum TaxID=562976 RepID=A0ABP9YCC6_9FUNG
MKDLGDMYDGQSKQVLVLLKDESKPRSEVEDFIKKSYNNTLQEKRKFEELADDDSSLDNNNAYVEEESTLRLIDKGLYVLDEVYSFSYPKTIKQLKGGDIDALIKGLITLENMIDELKDLHQNNKRSTEDEINLVKNVYGRPSSISTTRPILSLAGKKRLSSSGSTSDVEWCPAKEFQEKDDDDDAEEAEEHEKDEEAEEDEEET